LSKAALAADSVEFLKLLVGLQVTRGQSYKQQISITGYIVRQVILYARFPQ